MVISFLVSVYFGKENRHTLDNKMMEITYFTLIFMLLTLPGVGTQYKTVNLKVPPHSLIFPHPITTHYIPSLLLSL